MTSTELSIRETVQVLFFIEGGEQCWTLDIDDVEKCKRRDYPYKIVEYKKPVDNY